jgi:transposase
MRIFVEFELRRVACRRCGAVKRERLDFLADNPRYTKRFAFYVGRRCRAASIQDIAEELHLEWHTVKQLEMQDMREQLRRAGRPSLVSLQEEANGAQINVVVCPTAGH